MTVTVYVPEGYCLNGRNAVVVPPEFRVMEVESKSMVLPAEFFTVPTTNTVRLEPPLFVYVSETPVKPESVVCCGVPAVKVVSSTAPLPAATVVPTDTSVALAPPEQNVGVPVPVNTIPKEAFTVSPEFSSFDVGFVLAGTTRSGEEQLVLFIEPYPTPLMRSLPVD